MTEYEPELGQAIFGQPHKQYSVPDIWEAALTFLAYELERVMRNERARDFSDPFANTAASFDCPKFNVEAYSWNEDYEQPFNFKWQDVEISWYKYLGRGMSANQELSPERAAEMLSDCLGYLRERDRENLRAIGVL